MVTLTIREQQRRRNRGRPCGSSGISKSRGRGRENQRRSRENRNRGQRQQQSNDTAGGKSFRYGILPAVLQLRYHDICILAYGDDVVQPDTFYYLCNVFPISFLLSMIPSQENLAKQAIVRVFNTIMTRSAENSSSHALTVVSVQREHTH